MQFILRHNYTIRANIEIYIVNYMHFFAQISLPYMCKLVSIAI